LGEKVKQNVTFRLGSIVLIDKADDYLNEYFNQILNGVGGKAKDFIPCVKLLTVVNVTANLLFPKNASLKILTKV